MYTKYLMCVLCAFILTITISTGSVLAQDKNIPKDLYVASTIPDSLKDDVHSVLRYRMEDVTVKNPGHSVEKVHTIVTVLDEKSADEAEIRLPYNRKYSTVGSFEMIIYDAAGKQLKKYHKGDMYEHATEDGITLASDDRLLFIRHTIANYPTTVEMIYELDNSSNIDLGHWVIQEPEQSVQSSFFRITINKDAGFRYLNKNTNIQPQKTTNGDVDSYSWSVSNLKGSKMEEGAQSWRVLPQVSFAANAFEYYGIKGDISSWQNYGSWIKALNADVCSLTPEREAEIRKMTDTIKTDEGKARFLYNYLQQNMRYVSIQLGIGGLKPFPAMFVDQKKYGDCKALSNYMTALLKAVNIPSYYAVINAGANEEPASFSFPSNPFNHIIVCIPFKSDTTWLECTSNTTRFGKLGSFTENRTALLITENGGKLVRTPKSKMEDNQFNSEVHIVLDADGGAKAQVKILSTGGYREDYIGMAAIKADEQKEYLLRDLHIKQPSAFEFTSGKDVNYTKEIDLNLEYDTFCDVKAGDKIFYKPLAFNLWNGTVAAEEKRKSDYYFEFPLQKSCVTTIDLPAGFEVETLPVNQSLKFTYGSYDISYAYDAAKNQVTGTAKLKLTNQVIPAVKYTELQQYMDAVVKAQNKKLVIRHKA